MLSSTVIIDVLKKEDVCFYSGVPDSLLKEFCMELDKPDNGINHIIAANEGCAVGMAIGNYLVTGKIPVVYLQNSGIGNITNPVCSLSAEEVFRIPLLFIIGWRGEIDQNGIQLADEPQHRMQGETTLSLLESLRIPYSILTPEMEDENAEEIISELITLLRHSLTPVALVVRKNTFKKLKNNKVLPYISAFKEHMSREHALEECVTRIPYGTPVVCTTGMLSRELFEIREKKWCQP
ncbi:hypothetical protein MAY82_13945 [Edwardsiella ictaluri]|nr:thiamine pyrophosphate-binding protein [Edwardsiella ictaluri]WFO12224.1 hypothetical protein MAY82_13945 [Edwardsiella ictaluri]